MSEFWKHEEPEQLESSRLQFKFFKTAGKLQIRRYSKYGAFGAVTLDRRAITPEMSEIIKNFLELEVKKEGE